MGIDINVDGLSVRDYRKLMSFDERAPTLDGRKIEQIDAHLSAFGKFAENFKVFSRRVGRFFTTFRWENNRSLLKHLYNAVVLKGEGLGDETTIKKIGRILNCLEFRLGTTPEATAVREKLQSTEKEKFSPPILTRGAKRSAPLPALSVAKEYDLEELLASFESIYSTSPDMLVKPVGMSNHDGVTCYINGSLQALFASPKFIAKAREKFGRNMDPKNPDYEPLKRIHAKLNDALDARGKNDSGALKKAVIELRRAVFQSDFRPCDIDEDRKAEIEKQQDAGAMLIPILKAVGIDFENRFIDEIPGVGRIRAATGEKTPMVEVPLIPGVTDLQRLLNGALREVKNDLDNPRIYNGIRYPKYTRLRGFSEVPEVLVLRLMIGGYNLENGAYFKRGGGITLPRDGVIKFPGGNYRIVGIVNHSGSSLNRGHYISSVFYPNGRYFCDDSSITKNGEPYGDPYVFVLEKIDS